VVWEAARSHSNFSNRIPSKSIFSIREILITFPTCPQSRTCRV
jgi:hypothetical protein